MTSLPLMEHQQLDQTLGLGSTGRLHRTDTDLDCLPSQPRVRLQPDELDRFLRKDLLVPHLDRLVPKLWLVATPRHSHISPLHHQAVRGRTIVLTENPQLHLVWHNDKIFVKPIPRYLLSRAFLQYLTTQPAPFREAAIGFMRTYLYLICSEHDFAIAREKKLVPCSGLLDNKIVCITWDTFARFIDSFDGYGDEDVSLRYTYGELRLTRLNFWSRIFLGKLTYHHIDAQWGPFLSGCVTPFVTFLGFIAVILSAMQVELAAQTLTDTDSRWEVLISFSNYFSVIVMLCTASIVLSIVVLMIVMMVHDHYFAYSVIRAKRKDPTGESWKERKSGVV